MLLLPGSERLGYRGFNGKGKSGHLIKLSIPVWGDVGGDVVSRSYDLVFRVLKTDFLISSCHSQIEEHKP